MFDAYIFSAKQIQTFIFETSKLRDSSGGSELLNKLAFEALGADSSPADLAAAVMKTAGLEPLSVMVHRRAGGVLSIVVTDDLRDKLRNFRTFWRLSVAAFTPGLTWTDGIGTGAAERDAINAARNNMLNAPPATGGLPPFSSPLVRLATRSGHPPTPKGAGIKGGKCKITDDYIDEATRAKRRYIAKGELLLPFLFAGENAKEYKWPLRFDDNEKGNGKAFPFIKGQPKRMAIIHIDGNGVGQVIANATAAMTGEKTRELSRSLARVTQQAAQLAMENTVLPFADKMVVPARPVLIGGDDLTLVLRADLAVKFVCTYIQLFEHKTKVAFEKFSAANLPKDGLKAKAGIVFLGAHQPFAQGYELCESLAAEAKHADHSRVSFVRLTNAFIPGSAQAVKETRAKLWRPAWKLNELAKLCELARFLADEDVGRGALRRVPELLARSDIAQASSVYKRAMSVLKNRNENLFGKLKMALDKYDISADCPVNEKGYSPLLDAHDLGQIMLNHDRGQL